MTASGYTGNTPGGGSDIPLSQKGAANGVATLDGTTHIPAAQIPNLSGTYVPLTGGTGFTMASGAVVQQQTTTRTDVGYANAATGAGFEVYKGTDGTKPGELVALFGSISGGKFTVMHFDGIGNYLPVIVVQANGDTTIAGALAVSGSFTGEVVDSTLAVRKGDNSSALRFRSTGGAVDIDKTAGDVVVSAFAGATPFTGTQTPLQRWRGDGTSLSGSVQFGSSVYASEQRIETSTGVAYLGAKNSLTNVQVCGQTATAGAPTTGTWAVGDSIVDSVGRLWQCTGAGTPGTWTTPVLVLGPATAVPAGTAAGTVIVRTAT